jgi:hypothetical protein
MYVTDFEKSYFGPRQVDILPLGSSQDKSRVTRGNRAWLPLQVPFKFQWLVGYITVIQPRWLLPCQRHPSGIG